MKLGRSLTVAALLWCCGAAAASVGFTWTQDADTNVLYRLHYGPAARGYTNGMELGYCANTIVTLGPGTYYFALTAYNAKGESGFSNELTRTLPAPLQVGEPPIGRRGFVGAGIYEFCGGSAAVGILESGDIAMNQKEALTVLYEATVEMDAPRSHIRQARKVIEKRIEVLRRRYRRRHLLKVLRGNAKDKAAAEELYQLMTG